MIYKIWDVNNKRYIFEDFSLTATKLEILCRIVLSCFSRNMCKSSLIMNPFWFEYLTIFNILGTPPHIAPPNLWEGLTSYLIHHLVKRREFGTLEVANCQFVTTWRTSSAYPSSFLQVHELVIKNSLILYWCWSQ